MVTMGAKAVRCTLTGSVIAVFNVKSDLLVTRQPDTFPTYWVERRHTLE